MSQSRNSIRTLRFLLLLLVTSACAQVPEGKTVAPLDLSYDDKVYYLLFDAALGSKVEYEKTQQNYQAFDHPFCLWINDGQRKFPSPALRNKIEALVSSYPMLNLASEKNCEQDINHINAPLPFSNRHIFVSFCKHENCIKFTEEQNVDVGEYGGFLDGTDVVIMKSGNKVWLGTVISRWVV